ncbi:MAG TPA: M14 family metallopeptidase [Chthonomonadaceae bacterium]|nr:M14 family metallopeptidase [Chthonomonadaceae bacterium]
MRVTFICIALLLLSFLSVPGQTGANDALQTRAEQTHYEETSRYEDVIRFITELQQRSPLLRVETFGHTQEGRALPLMILADPPVSTPQEAKATGKPIVFVMANIHAGEVEGKEAILRYAQRVLNGDSRRLLDKIVLLIAPIYNADGNEKINVQNRTAQYGPIGGVGVRENSQGLDLNRDYIKMDAPETRALIRLFNRWDPHLTVDLHTTDGSYHGYHLTYSIPLNPTVDPRLTTYHRDKMMPTIAQAMLKQHGYRTYYYGNFSGPAPKPGEKEQRTWRAFSQQPRVGTNYVGFRNRLSILSEAYSYLDFHKRIDVTEAFVADICDYVAAHGEEIRQLTRRLDQETVRRGMSGPPLQIGVEYAMRPLPKPLDILVGEVKKVPNPRSGRDMTAMVEDKITPVKMQDYGEFEATRKVPAAQAYLLAPEPGLRAVVEKLQAQGVTMEELTAPLTTEVESFTIAEVNQAGRPFQGHSEVRLKGQFAPKTLTFPVGTLLIRTAQPLGILAAYLLEPESDDGLVTWNFLDAYLGPGKVYPAQKCMHLENAATRILSPITPMAPVSPPQNSTTGRSAPGAASEHEE